jgi:hypothetical protein
LKNIVLDIRHKPLVRPPLIPLRRPFMPVPSPVKHPRYPRSEEKRMTIAAGFVVRNGILLCADSQYSGWEKVYKDKLFCRAIGPAMVGFALAGDDDYGRSIIEDCYQAATSIPHGDQTIWTIRKAIRRVISRELKSVPSDREKPQFLVAISTRVESALFSTNESSMPRVDKFDFRGSGSYIAYYIMKSLSPAGIAQMSVENAALIGMCILTAAKRNDFACGGGSQFLVVRATSGIRLGNLSVDLSDIHMDEYEFMTRNLMMTVGDSNLSDDEFQKYLTGFNMAVTDLRTRLCTAGSSYRGIIDTLKQGDSLGLP